MAAACTPSLDSAATSQYDPITMDGHRTPRRPVDLGSVGAPISIDSAIDRSAAVRDAPAARRRPLELD